MRINKKPPEIFRAAFSIVKSGSFLLGISVLAAGQGSISIVLVDAAGSSKDEITLDKRMFAIELDDEISLFVAVYIA
ncbi:hypothetical protein GCM10023069_55850 [Shinella granuli]